MKKEKLRLKDRMEALLENERPDSAAMSLLAPEGYPYVVVPTLAGIFAWVFGYAPVAVLLWMIGLLSAAFFRDPTRSSDAAADAVLAPADGKVIRIDGSPPRFAEMGLPVQVSIFMSPANVHVNHGADLRNRHTG